jgi:PAS domain-containing protein
MVIDDQGLLRFVNPAAAQLFGRKSDELVNQLLGLPIINNEAAELEIVHLDGKLIVVEMRIVEISWEGKKAYLASLRNITSRKEAEKALQESQTRLTILNNISIAITAGMSVEQVIETTLQQIRYYFPDLRVSYSTINQDGNLIILHSQEPPLMPSLKGMAIELVAAPEIWRNLNMGKSVIIPDVSNDHRVKMLVNVLLAYGTKALIQMPLPQWEGLVELLSFESSMIEQWSDYHVSLYGM